MKKHLIKTTTLMIMIAIVIAGVFCYENVTKANSHCMTEETSAICNDGFAHQTIVHNAIVSVLFSLALLGIIAFVFKYLIPKIRLFYILKNEIYWRTQRFIHIPIPIRIAFSRGIIHPKKPKTVSAF